MKHIGLFERNGHGSEGLPTLLVNVVVQHGGKRRLDLADIRSQGPVVRRTEPDGEPIGSDRRVSLMLQVKGGLLLQCVCDLVGLHRSAEQSREGVADRALKPAFESLDDAHVTSFARLSPWLLGRTDPCDRIAIGHCPGCAAAMP